MLSAIAAGLKALLAFLGLANKAADAQKAAEQRSEGVIQQAQADDAAAAKTVAAERDAATGTESAKDALRQGKF